jgi:hypothetical protein
MSADLQQAQQAEEEMGGHMNGAINDGEPLHIHRPDQTEYKLSKNEPLYAIFDSLRWHALNSRAGIQQDLQDELDMATGPGCSERSRQLARHLSFCEEDAHQRSQLAVALAETHGQYLMEIRANAAVGRVLDTVAAATSRAQALGMVKIILDAAPLTDHGRQGLSAVMAALCAPPPGCEGHSPHVGGFADGFFCSKEGDIAESYTGVILRKYLRK